MARSVESIDRDMLVQSRALGDPTRHAVFVHLRDAPGPVSVAELTEHFGMNHNAIRQHLAKLREAGLVTEHRDPPSGPGRPPVRWKPVPGAAELWGGTNPYETLSMLLVEVIHGGASPREVGQRAGRRLAAGERRGDTVEILDAVARRLGFEPRLRPTRSGTDVVLERCPFVDAATAAPEIVCELHRGIAEGIAEESTDDAIITDVVVRTPRRAGCRITVAVAT